MFLLKGMRLCRLFIIMSIFKERKTRNDILLAAAVLVAAGGIWLFSALNSTAGTYAAVIVNGIEHIEYLPVMDYKNKSIPLKDITSFDVNKAIQRSLTKALARHGLGLYIYAGEDLPEETAQKTESEPDEATKRNYIATISRLLAETETDGTKMLEFINQKYGTNAAAFAEFSAEQLIFTLRKLEEKKQKKEK